ncbi:MAG: capsular exopolysaccharide family [Gemmatimonadetes bacterium]|nr:capsular exopolysaccharide family [Gemmatimonadota bacterium]
MSQDLIPFSRWPNEPIEPDPVAVNDQSMNQRRDGLLDLAIRFGGLVRRNWFLMLVIVSASVGAVAYRVRATQPSYRARAVLQLRDKAGSLAGGLSAANRPIPGTDAILSQIQVLHSRAVADEVVAKEGLRLRVASRELSPSTIAEAQVAPDAPNGPIHLAFAGGTVVAASGRARVQARYGEPLHIGGVVFTVTHAPDVESADLTVVSGDQAADEVLASLRGQPRERTTIVDVSYVAHDRLAAQRITNAAVDAFKALNARNEKQESVRRREFIQQQLDKTEAAVSEAQLQYNQYVARSHVFNAEDEVKTRQATLADIATRKQALESDQRTYLAMLDSLEDPAHSATFRERLSVLLAAPTIAGNPLVASQYAELERFQAARDSATIGPAALAMGSPEVRRLDTLIASRRSLLLKTARPQLGALTARIGALDDLQRQLSDGLASLPSVGAQESALRAGVETYRRQADRLHDAFQTAAIEEAAETGQVDIIDRATPGAPIDTGKVPQFALAGVLGLLLAASMAYALENRKDVVRRREELTSVSPLPNLALVPQFRALASDSAWQRLVGTGTREADRPSAVKRNAKKGAPKGVPLTTPIRSVVTVADSQSPGAEAYRTLRTNLLFSAAVHSLHRVTVSSAIPKEGKSTTAANLAAACAQQGQRVLLIDCDLRGPSMHMLFRRPRSPGLTNVLIGTVVVDDALVATSVANLTLLPAGTSPPNPAELLGSNRMRQLLDDLSQRFDLIIADTPPLLAASDAAIVGRITDGTVIVVRAGHTERSAVQEAIQQLHTVGARVLGTVLNDPDAEVAKYTPYYNQYYYNYHHTPRTRV